MTLFRVDDSNVSSLEQKRRERAGFEKLAVLETPDADLLAARDQADEGWEAFTLDNAPLTDYEAKQRIAREVDASRPKLLAAFKAADRDDLRDVQARLAAVVDEIDRIQVDLAGLGGAA